MKDFTKQAEGLVIRVKLEWTMSHSPWWELVTPSIAAALSEAYAQGKAENEKLREALEIAKEALRNPLADPDTSPCPCNKCTRSRTALAEIEEVLK